jgi:hypothetical protein
MKHLNGDQNMKITPLAVFLAILSSGNLLVGSPFIWQSLIKKYATSYRQPLPLVCQPAIR